MPKIIRRLIDSSVENMIATGMIMSKKFLGEVYPIFDDEYIKSPHLQKLCIWSRDFYEYHEDAPKHHIVQALDLERPNIPIEEYDILRKMLLKIDEEYRHRSINEDYFLSKSFQYFKIRELEITASSVQKCLDLGRLDDAEIFMNKYRKVERVTSGWMRPLSEAAVSEVFAERNEGLFTMPGQLGRLLGHFDRGWLIGILGSFKRGKTFWMLEIGVIAMGHRLKVAVISLEMKNVSVCERFFKRITASGSDTMTDFAFPVFDCKRNQDGTCDKPQRTNNLTVVEDGVRREFDPAYGYRPCTWCRINEPREYQLETWWEMLKKPKFTEDLVMKKVAGFRSMYGDNFCLKSYPRFTATINDIKRDLDILERTEGFIPDVIIVDYADIIKPERSSKRTEDVDEIWKELGGLAGERGALVITASQGNRGAIYKKSMSQGDLAEWIGKLGHVDMMFAINQTKIEKRYGRARIGLLAHRHQDFDEDIMCMVLQQLKTGQVELDTAEWDTSMGVPGGIDPEEEGGRRR